MKNNKKYILQLFFTTFLILTLSACVKNYKTAGYTFDQTSLAGLKKNQSTKKDIFRKLGSPSVKSDFKPDTWYYIKTEYEYVAFFDPKIKDQTVVAIVFNDDGTLSTVKKYSELHAKKIKFSKDKTPTEGHDLNIIEQLLGNIGRFESERNPLRR